MVDTPPASSSSPGAIAQLRLAISQIAETQERTAGISLRLGVAVDYLADELKRQREMIEQRLTDAPRIVPARNSVVISGTTQSILLGGPGAGRVWCVQAVGVGGTTPVTSAAGTADLFQSPADPATTAVDLTSWRDHTTALPNMGFYTQREVELRFPDRLWVVVNGGTSGQQYAAVAWVLDYTDGGYPAVESF